MTYCSDSQSNVNEPSSSYPYPTKWEQHVFHHVVIKIWQLFLRLVAYLMSTLLETGVGANDCKCNVFECKGMWALYHSRFIPEYLRCLCNNLRHFRYSSETTIFYQNDIAMRNTAEVISGKPIADWLQQLTLYSQRISRDFSDIPPRHPHFPKITYLGDTAVALYLRCKCC
jgi:hypothetical protein